MTATHRTPAGAAAVIDRVVVIDQQIAALEAAAEMALAELGELAAEAIIALPREQQAAELPLRDIAARLGARLRVSDRTVQHRIAEAQAVVTQFPTTVAAWEAGEISRGHVRLIVDAGVRIADPAVRAEFEREVLRVAREESVARTRPVAERLAERLDPRPLSQRHQAAREERRVRLRALPDGMSRLTADLPAVLGRGIVDRLTQLAEQECAAFDGEGLIELSERGSLLELSLTIRLRAGFAAGPGGTVDVAWSVRSSRESSAAPLVPTDAPGRARMHAPADPRTMDQRRTDLLADLLLTGIPSGVDPDAAASITAHVQLTVPVLTLLGDDSAGALPAEVAAHGPIDPSTARRLAADAPGWDRVLTDPVTGMVLAVDRYRPTEQQRRYLRARDVHCRFPACTSPARQCDIDHTIDHAHGGPTDVRYLAHECRRHHVLRHQTAWTVIPRANGEFEWIDPDGRHYRDRPPPTVGFVPDPYDVQQRRDGLRLTYDGDPPPF